MERITKVGLFGFLAVVFAGGRRLCRVHSYARAGCHGNPDGHALGVNAVSPGDCAPPIPAAAATTILPAATATLIPQAG